MGQNVKEVLEQIWADPIVRGAGHRVRILPEREAAVAPGVRWYFRLRDGVLVEYEAIRKREEYTVGSARDGTLRVHTRIICKGVMPLPTIQGRPLFGPPRPPDDELVVMLGQKIPEPPPVKIDWPE